MATTWSAALHRVGLYGRTTPVAPLLHGPLMCLSAGAYRDGTPRIRAATGERNQALQGIVQDHGKGLNL